ncbi:uncharacterized protein CC84DRAFT_1252994 [Paraphaeosphaeria sporulosa]|uniref:Uncharacterized protein n=1 Tax=Paraphaeosphaeria sporulosa TaxID=1460663 RepID=A0A177C580_9PLEO|nr:uncharacterized protein CC84DRAFT_1252994 [Paraphaeosphaeria sporulosa]OAG02311.1 hypothetical protein CC84DRAFT_1252994 [Paraphaeosphaeria sporulosa]
MTVNYAPPFHPGVAPAAQISLRVSKYWTDNPTALREMHGFELVRRLCNGSISILVAVSHSPPSTVLSWNRSVRAEQSCKNRWFILNHEGSLANYGSINETVITKFDDFIDILSDKKNDKKNAVYVMSGRTVLWLNTLSAFPVNLADRKADPCTAQDLTWKWRLYAKYTLEIFCDYYDRQSGYSPRSMAFHSQALSSQSPEPRRTS